MSPRAHLRPALAATACLLVVLTGCSDDGDAGDDPTGAAPTSTLDAGDGADDPGGSDGEDATEDAQDDPTDDATLEPDEEDGSGGGRPEQDDDGNIDLPSPGSDPTDDLPIDAAASVEACEEAAGEGFTWPDPAEVYYDEDAGNVVLTADVDADGSTVTMVCTVAGSSEDPQVLTLGEI